MRAAARAEMRQAAVDGPADGARPRPPSRHERDQKWISAWNIGTDVIVPGAACVGVPYM